MPSVIFRRLALALFLVYLALVPGVTIAVALDQVPAGGAWMGGALLLLQGASVLCWLIEVYGRRGALAATLVFLLGWGVEALGVTTGFPFGRYSYTGTLQPQLPGGVPLAIPCAWLMVAVGATHFRFWILDFGSNIKHLLVAATLVLLLDLQIETVATAINRYWLWLDGGVYYGVPAANFVAWWLVGLAMAALLAWALGGQNREPRTENREPRATHHASRITYHASRITQQIPTYLYLLSTLMFAAINLARGYTVAGLIGVVVLLVAASALVPAARRKRSVISD
jgi:bisanhydrobacterioruberin hydratase